MKTQLDHHLFKLNTRKLSLVVPNDLATVHTLMWPPLLFLHRVLVLIVYFHQRTEIFLAEGSITWPPPLFSTRLHYTASVSFSASFWKMHSPSRNTKPAPVASSSQYQDSSLLFNCFIISWSNGGQQTLRPITEASDTYLRCRHL